MRKLMIVCAVACVAMFAVVACGGSDDAEPVAPAEAPAVQQPAVAQPTDEPKPTDVPPTEAPKGVTMELYDKIENGMTYDEVVAIIGEPAQELSSSEIAGITSAMYQWNGAEAFSNMTGMFQNGKLVTKAQFGLK